MTSHMDYYFITDLYNIPILYVYQRNYRWDKNNFFIKIFIYSS